MNRKSLPLILMLVAGLVTVVITFLKDYSIPGKLGSLFAVLFVFYCIGTVIVWFLNKFDKENEEAALPPDDVIEKESEESVAGPSGEGEPSDTSEEL
ncbi:MAG: hypothetical protein K5891_01860 [Lachnospiraceae bacterium]|nr:hypothetical protein [Lachnospiraceae bacterium]